MNRRLCCILFLFVGVSCWGQNARPERRDRGQWSGEATVLLNTLPGDPASVRTQSVPSPDKRKLIRVEKNKIDFEVGGKVFPANFGPKFLAELGWAPDSSRFFLTWSDAGWGGTYHTEIYEASSAGLKEFNGVDRQARKDFVRRIRRMPPPKQFAQQPALGYWLGLRYCEPNIVGAQWLKGSSELLISVLVPNTSYCRYMSQFGVYRISVPAGRILQRYSAEEAHRQFDEENLPAISR